VSTEYDNASGSASGSSAGWNGGLAIQQPSYVTAADFMLLPNIQIHGKYNLTSYLLEVYCNWTGNPASEYFQVPSNYGPKLTLVGIPSRKIYIADGGLYGTAVLSGATPGVDLPNYTMEYHGAVPGHNSYSDFGAWDGYSRALCRGGDGGTQANGVPTNPPININPASDATDPRVYGFRHGILSPFGPTGSYKFNAGFFDGHVETFDDLTGADPSMWNPPGTQIAPAEVMLDVQATFFPNHVPGSQSLLTTGN
jgi:prepilin-type processing-associated H-X9-DG protein